MIKAGAIGNIMKELRTKKTFLTNYRDDAYGMKILTGYEMQSAYGMFMQSGVAVVSCEADLLLYSRGLRINDVVLSVNDIAAEDPEQVYDLLKETEKGTAKIVVWRNQQQLTIDPGSL